MTGQTISHYYRFLQILLLICDSLHCVFNIFNKLDYELGLT